MSTRTETEIVQLADSEAVIDQFINEQETSAPAAASDATSFNTYNNFIESPEPPIQRERIARTSFDTDFYGQEATESNRSFFYSGQVQSSANFLAPHMIAATTAISVIVPLIVMCMTYRQNKFVAKSVEHADETVAGLKEDLKALRTMVEERGKPEEARAIEEMIERQLKPILENQAQIRGDNEEIAKQIQGQSGKINTFIIAESSDTRESLERLKEQQLITSKDVDAVQKLQRELKLQTTEDLAGVTSGVRDLNDVNSLLVDTLQNSTRENESWKEQVQKAIDKLVEKEKSSNKTVRPISDSIKTLHAKANLSIKQQKDLVGKIQNLTMATAEGFEIISDTLNYHIEQNNIKDENLLREIDAFKEQGKKLEENIEAVKTFQSSLDDKTTPILQEVRELVGSIQGRDNTKDKAYMNLRDNVFNFQMNRETFNKQNVLDWLTGTNENKRSMLRRVFSPVNMYYYAAFYTTSAENRLPKKFFDEMRNLTDQSADNIKMLRTLYEQYMELLSQDDEGIKASLELMEKNATLLDDPNNQFVAAMRANMEKAMEDALEKEKNPVAAQATIDVQESIKQSRDQVFERMKEESERSNAKLAELTKKDLQGAAELVRADLERVENNVDNLTKGLESASDTFGENLSALAKATKEEFQKYGNILENLEKTLNQGNLEKAAELAETAESYEELSSFLSGGGEPDDDDDGDGDGDDSMAGDSSDSAGATSSGASAATSSASALGSEGEVTVPTDRDVTSSSSSSSSRKPGKRPTFTLRPLTLDPEDFIIEPIVLESDESSVQACSRLPYTHFAPSIKKETFARKRMCNLDNIEMLNPYLTTKSTVDYGDIICLPDDCLIPRSL